MAACCPHRKLLPPAICCQSKRTAERIFKMCKNVNTSVSKMFVPFCLLYMLKVLKLLNVCFFNVIYTYIICFHFNYTNIFQTGTFTAILKISSLPEVGQFLKLCYTLLDLMEGKIKSISSLHELN